MTEKQKRAFDEISKATFQYPQFEIPYFTLTPTFSVCSNHGYLNGEQKECPYCHSETEVYSRVVGYLRPTKNWNEAKQVEFSQRHTYHI